jgi:hypothetical protein
VDVCLCLLPGQVDRSVSALAVTEALMQEVLIVVMLDMRYDVASYQTLSLTELGRMVVLVFAVRAVSVEEVG